MTQHGVPITLQKRVYPFLICSQYPQYGKRIALLLLPKNQQISIKRERGGGGGGGEVEF
ncbi:MAG: hypothetical protein M3270_01175 [Thermoproteota archaeon]|nr:hypothetical protein [Thermoproteota archaeon]